MTFRQIVSAVIAGTLPIIVGADQGVSASKEAGAVTETLVMESLGSALRAVRHDDPKTEVVRISATETQEIMPMSPHDAYLFFGRVGCKEAVPALIKNLGEAEFIETKNGRRLCVCTWTHLHDALKAQTGKDFGFDQAAWQRWWDAGGKDFPESYFDPQKHENAALNLEGCVRSERSGAVNTTGVEQAPASPEATQGGLGLKGGLETKPQPPRN
jgi:hypothetical protein